MLCELQIENIAIIKKAVLTFSQGFTVMTGETGAGKSIVIDSINAVLGERTSRELIRTGADSAYVSALFYETDPKITALLREMDLPNEEDGSVLIQLQDQRRDRYGVCCEARCEANGQYPRAA